MTANHKQPNKRPSNHTWYEFQKAFLPKFSSGDPIGAISFSSQGWDPKFSFFSSIFLLLWGFSSAVPRHLSLDTGNSFGLKYTAESEFRRFLLKLSIVSPPKRSKIKFKNGNFKSDIISTMNLHFK